LSNQDDHTDLNDDGREDGREEPNRVRFQGIVEKPGGSEAIYGDNAYDVIPMTSDERRWNAASRQVWLMALLVSAFVFFSIIFGLPLGNYLAHLTLYGSADGWSAFTSYSVDVLMFAFIVPILVLLAGYLLSKQYTMITAAEAVAAAARQFVTPDATAVQNVNSVGAVVQGHIGALNDGLDNALTRLASAEAMIRQHVEAIEIAGEAIEQRAAGAVGRVADERSRLMELTESLNTHADSFAAAIAERAKTGVETMKSADVISLRAEKEFDERLSRLENAAGSALASFESLRDALRETEKTMRNSAGAIESSTQQTLQATEKARQASNAAAETAGINAANVAASAHRASQLAKDAADEAIETAAQETTRVSKAALDAAKAETGKLQNAAKEILGEVANATRQAIDGAVKDAARATKAAEDVAAAAQRTSETAAKASSDVAKASEHAMQSSKEALEFSEHGATRMEERNKSLADARAALEQENQRLETLIDEQRKRADRLADAIATQTERLSRLAEAQLREQEAAARIAEAQNEMQARAEQKAERERRNAKTTPTVRPPQSAPPNTPKNATLDLTQPAPASANKGSGARLDELARDIAERRSGERRSQSRAQSRKEPPLSLSASEHGKAPGAAPQKRNKQQVSWKEILDAADDAEPLDLAAADRSAPENKNGAAPPAAARDDAANAIKIIAGLQSFTYDLETRLYGSPPPALAERFDRGDRNVFANRLLRLNEADVKRRIRTESGRSKEFEQNIHEFLQGFEKLLEDATTSETADEELEEYLSSPLGRVYLLIGATVGYFA